MNSVQGRGLVAEPYSSLRRTVDRTHLLYFVIKISECRIPEPAFAILDRRSHSHESLNLVQYSHNSLNALVKPNQVNHISHSFPDYGILVFLTSLCGTSSVNLVPTTDSFNSVMYSSTSA